MLISTAATGGTLLLVKSSTSSKGTYEVSHDEASRLEWSAPVQSVVLQMPFIISYVTDGIEVHDMDNLICLQRIAIPGAVSLTASSFVGMGRNRNRGFGAFIGTSEQLQHFTMISLPQQVIFFLVMYGSISSLRFFECFMMLITC